MARPLDQLCACLHGAPPKDCDWTAVLTLANQSLVTPGLAAALKPQRDLAPAYVWTFLEEVQRRNRERNRRLWAQLADAVGALNDAGVEPVLLKGAALWASSPPRQPFDRLMSDIDLMVAPDEVEGAIGALRLAGFDLAKRYDGPSVHVVAELGRPQDVGYLDLHQRAPGPPGMAESPELAARRRTVAVAGGRVQVPDAASQVLQLVLHDQFHDGDYWRGGFDLRHLMDLARLAPLLTAADRLWLKQACGSSLVRAALEAELHAADRLIGGLAAGEHPSARARWTYRRWRLQQAYPMARLPLALMTLALEAPDVWAHQLANRKGRRRVLGEAAAGGFDAGERLDRWRRIATVASGKI